MASMPSSITVYVDPLGDGDPYRPFGYHPAVSITAAYVVMLLTSTCATTLGSSSGITTTLNILALILPVVLFLYCYSRPLNILRENKEWSDRFHAALCLELSKDAQLVNQSEFLIALRNNEAVNMEVYSGGKYKTYDTAVNDDEIVLFSMDDIDHDWALLNAESEY